MRYAWGRTGTITRLSSSRPMETTTGWAWLHPEVVVDRLLWEKSEAACSRCRCSFCYRKPQKVAKAWREAVKVDVLLNARGWRNYPRYEQFRRHNRQQLYWCLWMVSSEHLSWLPQNLLTTQHVGEPQMSLIITGRCRILVIMFIPQPKFISQLDDKTLGLEFLRCTERLEDQTLFRDADEEIFLHGEGHHSCRSSYQTAK